MSVEYLHCELLVQLKSECLVETCLLSPISFTQLHTLSVDQTVFLHWLSTNHRGGHLDLVGQSPLTRTIITVTSITGTFTDVMRSIECKIK